MAVGKAWGTGWVLAQLLNDNNGDYCRSCRRGHMHDPSSWKSRMCGDMWFKSGARPVHIPATPPRAYTYDGWQGYRHWLGALYCVSRGCHHDDISKWSPHVASALLCHSHSLSPHHPPPITRSHLPVTTWTHSVCCRHVITLYTHTHTHTTHAHTTLTLYVHACAHVTFLYHFDVCISVYQ